MSTMSPTDYADARSMVNPTSEKTYQRGTRGVKAVVLPSSEVKARLSRKVSSDTEGKGTQESVQNEVDVDCCNPLFAAMQNPNYDPVSESVFDSSNITTYAKSASPDSDTSHLHGGVQEGNDWAFQRQKLIHATMQANKIEYISSQASAGLAVDNSPSTIAIAGWDVIPIKSDELPPIPPPSPPPTLPPLSHQVLKSILLRHRASKRDTLANLYDYFDVELSGQACKNTVHFADQVSPSKQRSGSGVSSTSSTTLVEGKMDNGPPIPKKNPRRVVFSPVIDYNSPVTPLEPSEIAYTYFSRSRANSTGATTLSSKASDVRDEDKDFLQRGKCGAQSFTEGKQQCSNDLLLTEEQQHFKGKLFKDLLWK